MQAAQGGAGTISLSRCADVGCALGAACLVAVLVVVGALPALGAAAQTTRQPPTPALVPSQPGPHGYFEYTLSPGQSVTGAVTVGNPGPGPATFVVYPVDGTTSAATGVAYGGEGSAPLAAGAWIALGVHTLTLAAGQSQVVAFRLTVPPGAFPGDHVGGIAAQNQADGRQVGNAGNGARFAMNVQTRVVVAAVVHVPGPAAVAIGLGRPRLVAQAGVRQVVQLPMNDSGGLLAKPMLTAGLTRCSGGLALATVHQQLDTMVPHTGIVFAWSLGQLVLAPGCYRVTAMMALAGTTLSATTGDVRVTPAEAQVTPPRAVAPSSTFALRVAIIVGVDAAVGVLAALLLIARRSRHRRRALEAELNRLRRRSTETPRPEVVR